MLTKFSWNSARIAYGKKCHLDFVCQHNFTGSKSFVTYRVSEQNPLAHCNEHVGMFYTIPPQEMHKLDPFKQAFRPELPLLFDACNETCLMIRKPALSVLNYLQNTDFTLPNLRYVLYGNEPGVGKSCVLFHILHYGFKSGWLLLHFPNAAALLKNPKEISVNDRNNKYFDTPLEAVEWLNHFTIQNNTVLTERQIKIKNNYVWNTRESCVAGTFLTEMISYACDRLKYASDCVGAVIKEIKQQAFDLGLKVLVLIDGVNAYFGETWAMSPSGTKMLPDEFVIVRNIKKLLQSDWRSAATVCTVGPDEYITARAIGKKSRLREISNSSRLTRARATFEYDGPCTPVALLRTTGFNSLDPFIPIEISKLTDTEISNYLAYYIEKNWFTNRNGHNENGKTELTFLSGRNALQLSNLIGTL